MTEGSNNTDSKELENAGGFDIKDTYDIYPIASVRVEKAQYSTMHLHRMITVRNELILSPDYQRENVWKTTQQSELIESILMGIPLPIIYLFETKDGKRQVVDGKQRISAIIDFIDDKLILQNLKILKELNGKKFSQLDTKLQGKFEDFQLFFYIIQPPTPERIKYDIFDRVNRGGTQINNQEMRNALYNGKATEWINRLAEEQSFLSATGNSINTKHMKDRYVVLRALSFYMLYKKNYEIAKINGSPIEYKSDVDDFLAKIMIFINEKATDEFLDGCEKAFLNSLQKCYKILGEDAFRFPPDNTNRRRPISMPLLEMLIYAFTDEKISIHQNIAKKKILKMKQDYNRLFPFDGASDSSTSVWRRKKIADDLINEICYDK